MRSAGKDRAQKNYDRIDEMLKNGDVEAIQKMIDELQGK
jgi:hypothetical protein